MMDTQALVTDASVSVKIFFRVHYEIIDMSPVSLEEWEKNIANRDKSMKIGTKIMIFWKLFFDSSIKKSDDFFTFFF